MGYSIDRYRGIETRGPVPGDGTCGIQQGRVGQQGWSLPDGCCSVQLSDKLQSWQAGSASGWSIFVSMSGIYIP